MTEKITHYFNPFEFKSIIIPGGYVLSFLLITHPSLESFIATITLGGFSLFVFLSFIVGQLINSLSYFPEKLLWYFFGGMPTDWVFGENRQKKKWIKILTETQILKLDAVIQKKLIIDLNSLHSNDYRAVVHQLRLNIHNDKLQRLVEHNTNYCLHRSLSTASALLACYLFFIYAWTIGIILIICSFLFLYRMYRFGIYYARELFLQFINASHSEG
ncbi:MAG: hypothetical protein Q8Q56_00645 [Alphaproteobacteria bacterium]|nr:hypothetical protein [Alphaproteobacteria bacterium]